ncbi:MAG: hypothetical protein J7494_08725 [Sphingobium sp.]|nr:hypothetical protein [Sphingobium sp.]
MIASVLLGWSATGAMAAERPQSIALNASSSKELSASLADYVACLDTRIADLKSQRTGGDLTANARAVRSACLDQKATAVQASIADYEKWPELTGARSALSASLRVVESFDADVEWKLQELAKAKKP